MKSSDCCANCKHYVEWGTRNNKPRFQCEGEASKHVEAQASDDWGLESWFQPPETFCCNGWEATS